MNQEYLEEVLMNTISLYTKGTLRQYGLSEEASLEIVSNITKLSPEKLQELRQQRAEELSNSFGNSPETINNIITR